MQKSNFKNYWKIHVNFWIHVENTHQWPKLSHFNPTFLQILFSFNQNSPSKNSLISQFFQSKSPKFSQFHMDFYFHSKLIHANYVHKQSKITWDLRIHYSSSEARWIKRYFTADVVHAYTKKNVNLLLIFFFCSSFKEVSECVIFDIIWVVCCSVNLQSKLRKIRLVVGWIEIVVEDG